MFDRDRAGAVDVSDPALPPGLTEEKIAAGIAATLKDMRDRGWEAAFCAIRPDDSLEETISSCLKTRFDVVVIGGGIRILPNNLELFERVINATHRGASDADIAFKTRPKNSAHAAERWLSGRS